VDSIPDEIIGYFQFAYFFMPHCGSVDDERVTGISFRHICGEESAVGA
jgi:hypothetical protein